eukprot:314458_1
MSSFVTQTSRQHDFSTRSIQPRHPAKSTFKQTWITLHLTTTANTFVRYIIIVLLAFQTQLTVHAENVMQKVSPLDGAVDDAFGCSVSIDSIDENVLIGAFRAKDDKGSAYIFENINGIWTQTTNLSANDSEKSDRFGVSVSIHNGYALIGAYQDDNQNGDNAGSAYIQILTSMYYYQFVAVLLLSSNNQMRNVLLSFVNLFNLNIIVTSSNKEENGYCFTRHLTAVQKIVSSLSVTACIILFIFILYFLKRWFHINILTKCNKRTLYGQAFIAAGFICVGQILSVLLQLLACRQVGSESVHYFFASTACYGTIWWSALCGLAAVILYMIILFAWICTKSRDILQCDIRNEAYKPAVWCYKKKYFYWELILFIRRLVLSLVVIVFGFDDLKMLLAVLLLIYWAIHTKCQPFNSQPVNELESYLIIASSAILFLEINYENNASEFYANVINISFLILFPMIWFIVYVLIHCIKAKQINKSRKSVSVSHNTDQSTQSYMELQTVEMKENETAHDIDTNESLERLGQVADSGMVPVDGGAECEDDTDQDESM